MKVTVRVEGGPLATYPEVVQGDFVELILREEKHVGMVCKMPSSINLRVFFFNGRIFTSNSLFGNLRPEAVRKLTPGEKITLIVNPETDAA